MRLHHTRERRGFAYIWVLVTVAVLAAIIAAAAPYLYTTPDPTRISTTIAELRAIGVGVNTFEATEARKFPGKISYLDIAITTTSVNSCWATNAFAAADVTTWNNNAPYITSYLPTGGVWTPIGLIRDSIPNRSSNHNDSIWLEMPGVSAEDARLLDITVDGTADGTKDTIRFHTPVNDTTTIRVRVTPRELGRC